MRYFMVWYNLQLYADRDRFLCQWSYNALNRGLSLKHINWSLERVPLKRVLENRLATQFAERYQITSKNWLPFPSLLFSLFLKTRVFCENANYLQDIQGWICQDLPDGVWVPRKGGWITEQWGSFCALYHNLPTKILWLTRKFSRMGS